MSREGGRRGFPSTTPAHSSRLPTASFGVRHRSGREGSQHCWRKPELPWLVVFGRVLSNLHGQCEGLLASGEAVPYPTFLNRVFGLYGKINNKPLVGNKTSGYVRRIPALHALWPKAKFVHIIRDGRDVCLSVLNWKKAERTAGRYASWEEDPVSTTALWWERKVRKGREDGAALGPGLYHEMHYEALVEDPQRECERLCEFLGVPYYDAMIRFHEGRERVEPGRGAKSAWLRVTSGLRDWRTEMCTGDVECFEAAAGDLLEELGYERAVPNPSSEALEQAARIREAFTREALASGDQPPGSWA